MVMHSKCVYVMLLHTLAVAVECWCIVASACQYEHTNLDNCPLLAHMLCGLITGVQSVSVGHQSSV